MKRRKAVIMGAGGRDFFMYQRHFANYESHRVIAFTAAQIPGIDRRIYPLRLAGMDYPKGVPIYPEEKIGDIIREARKDGDDVDVFFAYSDVSLDHIKKLKDSVESYGAKFIFEKNIYMNCMINSKKPVIAVTAIRTGCGKSAVSRYIGKFLKNKGLNPILVRHPMPYFDLNDPRNDVQRFTSREDIDRFGCTFEEREEYEPIIDAGLTVYAGVNYKAILEAAEREADVIIWDGGNNDLPFYKPDLWITVVDPYRVDDVIGFKYPHGYWNLKSADMVIINKTGTANEDEIRKSEDVVEIICEKTLRQSISLFKTDLSVTVNPSDADFIKNKLVIAVEDGPTVTHGGMSFGAAVLAAKKYGAELADPRPYLDDPLRKVFVKYQHLWKTKILPCMGYNGREIAAMERTINATPADAVIAGTPIDLGRALSINKLIVRVFYDLAFTAGGERDYLGEAGFRAEVCAKIRRA